MIREGLSKLYVKNSEFRNRGEIPGRLENFHDAIFALSITLLLISSEPPTHFNQIKRFVYDLLPFAGCIVLILLVWNSHFIFFYRYGFQKGKILFLDGLFLFMVLFYVYPLKFLTKLLIEFPMALAFDNEELLTELKSTISAEDVGDLMIIYGIGASSVFLILAFMYRYALKQAAALDLSEIEKFDTHSSFQSNLLLAVVPFISALLAIVYHGEKLVGALSGMTYFLYSPVMSLFWYRVGKKRKKLISTLPDQI